jgi:hypothetical protein
MKKFKKNNFAEPEIIDAGNGTAAASVEHIFVVLPGHDKRVSPLGRPRFLYTIKLYTEVIIEVVASPILRPCSALLPTALSFDTRGSRSTNFWQHFIKFIKLLVISVFRI